MEKLLSEIRMAMSDHLNSTIECTHCTSHTMVRLDDSEGIAQIDCRPIDWETHYRISHHCSTCGALYIEDLDLVKAPYV